MLFTVSSISEVISPIISNTAKLGKLGVKKKKKFPLYW
jgi:hypothetical protein